MTDRPTPRCHWILSALACLLFLFPPGSHAAPRSAGVVTGNGIRVRYAEGLAGTARQLANAYPGLKADLEGTFGWSLPVTPTVYLMTDGERFSRMAGSAHVVAVAWPARNRIIMDWPRVNRDPFTPLDTLKHEVCHLILHHHIRPEHLPRWLDEGVCQWVSDGLTELALRTSTGALQQAVLTGRVHGLDTLSAGFPRSPERMALAYAESKSVVQYLIRRYGVDGFLGFLDRLKTGHDLARALADQFGLSPGRLEKQWRRDLTGRIGWLTWVASHLYQILFFTAGLAAAIGFFRQVRRRRRYTDEEEEEDLE